ncbi:MAG: HDIG domain-containing protein, partial [Candidatus Stahlbacteria bacterium]|nr:HDIG domain-containing protein [Candidatus Stahlbacteria bacterium]
GNLLDHLLLTMKKVEEFYTNEYVVSLPVLKLGALLHDIGKPDCYSEEKDGTIHFYGHEEKGVELLDSIRKQVNLSNDEFKVLQSLLRYHMRPHLLAREKNLTNKAIWRLVRDGGEESPAIFLLAYADALASGGKGSKEVWELLKRGIEIWNEMRQPKFKPLLTGDDLIEIGFKPGPIFREILEQVEEARIEGELHTTEEALKFVKRFNLKRFNLKRFNLKENFYEN